MNTLRRKEQGRAWTVQSPATSAARCGNAGDVSPNPRTCSNLSKKFSGDLTEFAETCTPVQNKGCSVITPRSLQHSQIIPNSTETYPNFFRSQCFWEAWKCHPGVRQRLLGSRLYLAVERSCAPSSYPPRTVPGSAAEMTHGRMTSATTLTELRYVLLIDMLWFLDRNRVAAGKIRRYLSCVFSAEELMIVMDLSECVRSSLPADRLKDRKTGHGVQKLITWLDEMLRLLSDNDGITGRTLAGH